MKRALAITALLATTTTAAAFLGCGSGSGDTTEHVGLRADTQLPKRTGAIIVDGCVLDTYLRSMLGLPSTRKIAQEVVLLCSVPREDGTVGPRDPSARSALAGTIADLKKDGYRVHLGVSFTDETGQRYDGAQTRSWLASPAFRQRVRETLPVIAEAADGVEIDLQQLPNDTRPFITELIRDLSSVIRPTKKLNIFVPPSVTNPSDLPGGDAISRSELAPFVDRMRIMTLDFSEATPGPTIDPGWAVDAVRLAKEDFANVDVSYPLYGTDWGPRGRRSATYHEARAIAAIGGATIERGPTGAPFLRYVSFGNEQHEMWFDDAESTGRALGAWTYDVLPPDVGILYYGLGAEDPAVFDRLAARTP